MMAGLKLQYGVETLAFSQPSASGGGNLYQDHKKTANTGKFGERLDSSPITSSGFSAMCTSIVGFVLVQRRPRGRRGWLAAGREKSKRICAMQGESAAVAGSWKVHRDVKSCIPRAESNPNKMQSKTLPFDASKELGAIPPLGYFDPLGICQGWHEAGFRFLRIAELKHGRVAMLATVGAVVQHYIRLPGFQDVPAGIGALDTDMGKIGMVVLVAFCGCMEEFVWKQDEKIEPGNFAWDPLELNMYNDEMRNKELSNGRMAMISIVGILAAEFATGKDAVEQLGVASTVPVLAPVVDISGDIGTIASTIPTSIQAVKEALAGNSAEVAVVGDAVAEAAAGDHVNVMANILAGGLEHGAAAGAAVHAAGNVLASDHLASITAGIARIAEAHPEKLAVVADMLAKVGCS